MQKTFKYKVLIWRIIIHSKLCLLGSQSYYGLAKAWLKLGNRESAQQCLDGAKFCLNIADEYIRIANLLHYRLTE